MSQLEERMRRAGLLPEKAIGTRRPRRERQARDAARQALGQRLREARASRGWSQLETFKRVQKHDADFKHGWITQYEMGAPTKPGPLTALATALDLDVDVLVTEAESVFKETVDN